MTQAVTASTKTYAAFLIADIILAVVILYGTWIQHKQPILDSLLLTFVAVILIIEVQSILLPAVSVWSERRLIVKGVSKVLSRADKLRKEAEQSVYGLWCYAGYAYPELTEYFRKEKALIEKGVIVHRLINIEYVGKEKAKKHGEMFKDEIIAGKYVLTAVNYHSREVIIIDRKKALILYQNLYAKDVAGGIGPYDDPNWVASYANEYEELEKAGTPLEIDRSNPQKSIEKWINLALAEK